MGSEKDRRLEVDPLENTPGPDPTADEKFLATLSYAGAPKMTTPIPGPKAQEIREDSFAYESMARGAGRDPLVLAGGRGATAVDPDGNLFIDMAAGTAVNAVGRCNPRVIKAMKEQMNRLMHAGEMSNVKRTKLACLTVN
ncbi:MAG: aminotransferase class III-fold pyridoxal phosphate-dependent enzyme [Firmicutes bacterium]|nr:aminotransferase class III-fold pyridoxal phosphate-dependent enzyme [Bacillota bacterium]